MASARQLALPLAKPGDESVSGIREDSHFVQSPQTCRPKPVRRVTIPKANGGSRPLGISTVLDRFIQQVREPRFHPHRYGFRPGRSAHQAARYGQRLAREGHSWVVDLDLEAFFAINRLKTQIRILSRCTRSHSLAQVIADLKETLLGWKAYFDEAEVQSPLRDLDKWIRRRMRCYVWNQWARRGYRELRKQDVSVEVAWNTAKSAFGMVLFAPYPTVVWGGGALVKHVRRKRNSEIT